MTTRRKLRLFELYENGLITKDVFRCRIERLLREGRESKGEKEPVILSREKYRKTHMSQSEGPQPLLSAAIDLTLVANCSYRHLPERVTETPGKGVDQGTCRSIVMFRKTCNLSYLRVLKAQFYRKSACHAGISSIMK